MTSHLKKSIITEFFRINKKSFGSLFVYKLTGGGGQLNSIGGRLAYRLRRMIGGFWNFSDKMLISNKFIEGEQITENDSIRKLNFTCAWITLYERMDNIWVRLGEVDNFKIEE